MPCTVGTVDKTRQGIVSSQEYSDFLSFSFPSYFMCMSVSPVSMLQVSEEATGGFGALRTRVIDDCEPLRVCWDLNTGVL